MKKISIIVPCYNAERYLRRCIDSLLHQTIGIENLELILVNDASEDCTLDILLEYEKIYPESILVINNEQNGRQGFCRNLGFSYASGEFVGYMDDDDWALDTMFEKLYEAAKRNDCEIAECNTLRTTSEVNVFPEPEGETVTCITNPQEREDFLVSNIQNMYIWHRIYRKDFMDRIQVAFPVGTFYEDEYFTTLVLSYVTRFCKVNETLHVYFGHPNATSQKGTAGKKEFDGMVVETALMEELRKRGLYEQCRECYDFRFMDKYYIEGLLRVFRKLETVTDDVLTNISVMQKTIRLLYPDFENNKYMRYMALELHREIIRSVYVAFTKETLAEYQKHILEEFEKSRKIS